MAWVVWRAVEQLAPFAQGCVLQDLGEGKSEDWDAFGLEGVFEMALVEDVALTVLDEEEDAGWSVLRGGAVGTVGGC